MSGANQAGGEFCRQSFLCTAAHCSSEIPKRAGLGSQDSQSLIHGERLIACAHAGIEGESGEGDLANDKAVVLVWHPRPSLLALTEFDGQPQDGRSLVSDGDQTRRSALDDAGHTGCSPGDEAAMSLADKNTVVPDQRTEGAYGARVRHKS